MRRLNHLSIDELLDLQQEYHLKKNEGEVAMLSRLVEVDKILIRKIKKDKDSENDSLLPILKQDLVSNLVRYGSYLKTEYRKDDYAAEMALKDAVRYDPYVPLAHYRLGFLSYKKGQFINSLNQFTEAIKCHEKDPERPFYLTKQQLYHANLYLSNSALYIAKEAQERTEKFEEKEQEKLTDLPLSPLYEMIERNEEYLRRHEFVIKTQKEERYASKKESEEMIFSDRLADTVILYISDHEIIVRYLGKKVELKSIIYAEILKHLMLRSHVDHPAIKYDFSHVLTTNEKSGEILTDNYAQNISRLRGKLRKCNAPADLIMTKQHLGERGYYYNQKYPYMVVQRTDDNA